METIAKAKIIVCFVDIRGSSRWTRRMGEDEESRHAFMMAYDRETLRFRDRSNAQFFKRIGDGRMLAYELERGRESLQAARAVDESITLIKRVDRIIGRLPSPRPTGFRARLMSGTTLNEIYPDGEKDWVGYVPNTCHKFLSVAPEVPLIVHETVKELCRPPAARNFAFSILQGQRRCPDGVDREDVDALWTVRRRA